MTFAHATFNDGPDTIPRLAPWVTSRRSDTLEDAAFQSGAALGHLHHVLTLGHVPVALLRARLALRAAEASVAHSGRLDRASALRDAVAFVQPGDDPGPAGEIYVSWRRAVQGALSGEGLNRALPACPVEDITGWLKEGAGGPVAQSASVLEVVLDAIPRSQMPGLMVADAVLARAMEWPHLMPLLSVGLKRRAFKLRGDELRFACHQAIGAGVTDALALASDLTRRTARLNAVAPKLRAKGAAAAVEMFLTRDALPPGALTSLGSNRAARRFCDRLVSLGAARELTGRDTFRLYGV